MVCHPFPQPSLAFHPQAQLCTIPSAPTCHVAAQCQDTTVKGHIRFLPSPLGLLHVRQAPPSDCPVQGLRTEVCAVCVPHQGKTSKLSVVRQHPPPVSCSQPLSCLLRFLRLPVGRKPRLCLHTIKVFLLPLRPCPQQGDFVEAKTQSFTPLMERVRRVGDIASGESFLTHLRPLQGCKRWD